MIVTKKLPEVVFFTVLLVLLVLAFLNRESDAPGFKLVTPTTASSGHSVSDAPLRPYLKKDFVCNPCGVAQVHAATLALTRSGSLRAFWWGGTKEAYTDVSLFSARTDAPFNWSAPEHRLNVDELSVGLGRYTKLIGNPTAIVDGNGRIWLFLVSVSAGGWSGSSINLMYSDDQGRTWSQPQKLITSPFFNVSTAVRGKPVLFSDGSIGVPVYHELIGNFSELLRVSLTGRVMAKYRITWGQHTLQPTLVVESPSQALALHRQRGTRERRIMSSTTANGGRCWSRATPTDLPNPDASVAALKARDGKYVLLFNNRPHDRRNLAVAVSTDQGKHWTVIDHVEKSGEEGAEYSYPTLLQAGDGMFHVVYTWKRRGVAHLQFNPAWIDRKLALATQRGAADK